MAACAAKLINSPATHSSGSFRTVRAIAQRQILADYMHSHEFKTIMGDIKFGPYGEWTKQASMQVQYHGITDAANLETWRGMSYQTVLTPADQKTGELIYPYAKAK
jgi:branched-chain amino acid transport system substrate-binding protein